MRMPKMAAATVAIAVAASVALPAGAASAHDRGDLELCSNYGDGPITIYADGPSFREANLVDECREFSVRPGSYELGVDFGEPIDGNCFLVRVTRNGHSVYKTAFAKGLFTMDTYVRKHRTTEVLVNPYPC